jgi:hypothetical protein
MHFGAPVYTYDCAYAFAHVIKCCQFTDKPHLQAATPQRAHLLL